MKCIGENILVEFIDNKLERELGNGHKLFIPERIFFEEVEGESKTQRITDRKIVNPQTAVVKAENTQYPHLKKGDKVFFHYGAYETRKTFKDKDVFVRASLAFFKCNDGIEPFDGIFIAKPVEKETKTAAGLWIPEVAQKEQPIVVITHAQANDMGISVGDSVYTVDTHQDWFEFDGEKHIRLSAHFIVSKAA